MIIERVDQRYKAATPETLRWIRDTIYKGDWALMVRDLVDRLGAKPYNHLRTKRIEADLKMIHHLQSGKA